MKLNEMPFLGPPAACGALNDARAVVVPFPYEGGVSFGRGAAQAPRAVLEASQQVEFYDDVLNAEPFRVGVATLAAPVVPDDPMQMTTLIESLTNELLSRDKFPIVIGGDHSISSGVVRALAGHFPKLGVIQLDAHADLRESYEGSALSHACVMARIREMTPHTLQVGIRSMALEEALRVRDEKLSFCTMHQWRKGRFDLKTALAELPQNVFLTLDVDVFDWSVIAGTGTPEPGGLYWEEALELLETIFNIKTVVGCDVVELACRLHDINSPYAVAKLVYKMIGFKYARLLRET